MSPVTEIIYVIVTIAILLLGFGAIFLFGAFIGLILHKIGEVLFK